ncbi:hypothetical protein [Amycolatopsis suaedae]|nr:hypothetical protein [Amycolatopsis suaedae]
MSVEDRLRAAMAKLDVAAREQDEQRALRDRRFAEVKEQAASGFQKEVLSANKYAEHMEELNKRKKEAGGWATNKTLSDKSHVMGFGTEEEETSGPGFTGYDPSQTAPKPAEPRNAGWEEPARAATPPPAPEPTVSAPPPRRRAGRHRQEESFDEDDFSNNSWMK